MAFQADSIFWVEVEKIVPNPFQPRREFDESKLKELSESVRMYGILQPLTVTRKEIQNNDGSFKTEYELIAGERRLRASKLAGLSLVPVIIREGEQSEQEKLELAIIENLQREDLNAVDRALAFHQLSDVFSLSHTQVAMKVGRSREYVSNTIRLLALPDYMLNSLRTNDITEGHARTLLMLNDRPEEQDVLFREILLKKLSVREVEKIARGIATERVRKRETIDNTILEIEKKFTDALGTRVSIVKTDFGGRLTIDYFSLDDLEIMLLRMRKEAASKVEVVSPAYRDESNDSVVSDTVDEAAAALAVLTASTGLEPLTVEPDNPAMLQPSYRSAALDATEAALAANPGQYTYETVQPAEAELVANDIPSVEELDFVPLPEAETESAPATVMVKEATSVIAPAPVASTNFSPSPAVIATAVTKDTPRLSLREQLASLLGSTSAGVTAASITAPEVIINEPVPEAEAIRETDTIESIITPKTVDDEDGNLYSISRFTI